MSTLFLLAPSDQPLTPEQRRFNQLVTRIEKARAKLGEWDAAEAPFAAVHAERIAPLADELRGLRGELVLRLDELLAEKGWSGPERHTLRRAACESAADLLFDERTGAADAARYKAVYDRHADVDFDTGVQDDIVSLKERLERASGIDLGDASFDSEDLLLRHARERLAEAADAQAEAAATAPRRAARKRPAQQRREQEAADAAQSLREVFRKLASALHPDRAADATERARRNELMQRVNRANDAGDLLGLFALQLEIEQVDAVHLQRATAERARHYNRVLADQLAALDAEAEARKLRFCMTYGILPQAVGQPKQLGALLEHGVRELRGALFEARQDLERLAARPTAKRWVRRLREQQAEDDWAA